VAPAPLIRTCPAWGEAACVRSLLVQLAQERAMASINAILFIHFLSKRSSRGLKPATIINCNSGFFTVCGEPVTHSVNRLNEHGLLRSWFNFFADPADVHIDAARRHRPVVTPDTVE